MSFESIFKNVSGTESSKKLENLFKKKTISNPNTQTILKSIAEQTPSSSTDKNKPVVEAEVKSSTKSTSTRIKKKKKAERDDEKESRTIFIGNLVNTAKKEDLLKIFKQYGKIEAIRFRNIVPQDPTKSKKYAFITKQQNNLKQTMNAFIRFENIDSAKNACEVNSMEFKAHHLRVDLADQSKKHDNKNSVFLGGLPFTIEEETIFKHFSQCGEIAAVRLIRDNKSGIGKGIGYVTFKTTDSIDLALKLNNSEIEERNIRVERCVKKQKIKKGNERNQTKKNANEHRVAGNNRNRHENLNEKKTKGNFKRKFNSNDKRDKTKKRRPMAIKTNKKQTNKLRF